MNHLPCDISFEELTEAYFDCRKNKRYTDSAVDFEINLESNLTELYKDLVTGQYQIGPSVCFVVKKPRVREIWAADFRDRIVHHLIYNRISPKFNRSFVADSCACIPGRGTKYGAERLERHIRSFTNNWTEDFYYLKCDLSNFFVSISKDVLWGLLEPKIEEEWVRDLTRMVLFHDPRVNAIFKSSEKEMSKVPKRKRLLLAPHNFGLPIGNLVSQFFANVLMDVFDKFVKHVLKVKKYVRYVDDFIILGESTEYLKQLLPKMEAFLDSLKLKLNPKKTVLQPIARGVSFVGQTIFPFRRVPLKNTVDKCWAEADERSSHNSVLSFFGQAQKSYNLSRRYLEYIEEEAA